MIGLNKSNQTIKRAIDTGDYVVQGTTVINTRNGRIIQHNIHPEQQRIRVKLYSYKVYLHRLVAYQKFGNIVFNPTVEVHHKDEDINNNNPDNLELMPRYTHLQRHAGEANKQAKLTWEQVRALRKEWNEGLRNYAALGRKYGLAGVNVKAIILNERWKE